MALDFAKCLSNAVIVQVDRPENHMSGKPTTQELARCNFPEPDF